jgi:hypothetical protein
LDWMQDHESNPNDALGEDIPFNLLSNVLPGGNIGDSLEHWDISTMDEPIDMNLNIGL